MAIRQGFQLLLLSTLLGPQGCDDRGLRRVCGLGGRDENFGASRSPGLSLDSWPAASPGQAAPPYTPPGSEDRKCPEKGTCWRPLQILTQCGGSIEPEQTCAPGRPQLLTPPCGCTLSVLRRDNNLGILRVASSLSDRGGLGTPAWLVLESRCSKGGCSWWSGMAGLPD